MTSKTILAISPSGVFNPDTLSAGIELLESWGHTVILSPNHGAQHLYTAGTKTQRLTDVEWAIQHPTGDCIWFVRGGYGTAQLLPFLTNPFNKPIIGFSDATALLSHGWNKQQNNMIHGPVLNSLATLCDEQTQQYVRSYLESDTLPKLSGTHLIGPTTPLVGPVVGGNLCVLASLCGSPYQLRTNDCILALEDIGEPFYKIDRMLLQLELSGMFEHIKGILLGTFEGCRAPLNSEMTLHDVFKERLAHLNIPIYVNAPFGHGATNWPWAQGQQVRLSPLEVL